MNISKLSLMNWPGFITDTWSQHELMRDFCKETFLLLTFLKKQTKNIVLHKAQEALQTKKRLEPSTKGSGFNLLCEPSPERLAARFQPFSPRQPLEQWHGLYNCTLTALLGINKNIIWTFSVSDAFIMCRVWILHEYSMWLTNSEYGQWMNNKWTVSVWKRNYI